MREYAVYKGEELLVIGTAEECADALKVRPEYIRWLTTPTAKRRLSKRKNPEKCVVGDVIS
ncbi:hypothetical protein [Paenibacillus brevis]|uniref:Uncharacterized protein n=1 Tax=Paenibacillus brevis TaxID=2841508 RepID=A0ABS6FSK8_9BACL|nr:hypothetical protein [Paenibacillus brevis]MBU5673222.1 hypothetical protein [Paenibacillus brevis]